MKAKDERSACVTNQILFLDEVHLLSSEMFFDAQAIHFTSTTKYIDPISHQDAMSRPDAKKWREAFDKEMNGLKKRNVFSVVDRPQMVIRLALLWSTNIRLTESRTQSLANIVHFFAEIGRKEE